MIFLGNISSFFFLQLSIIFPKFIKYCILEFSLLSFATDYAKQIVKIYKVTVESMGFREAKMSLKNKVDDIEEDHVINFTFNNKFSL